MAKRRSRGAWGELIAAWEASGLSAAEFCRRHRLSARTFAWWRWRLRSRSSDDRGTSPEFLPVRVVARAGEPASRIRDFDVLVGRVVLHVPGGFDEEALCRLLHVLESRPC